MTRVLPFAALLAVLAGCEGPETGPVEVVAIGEAPRLQNPNLADPGPAGAFLLGAAAQGLVRFDAGGEIEPALAQRWIVSDDGLRYTFRLADAQWADGSEVTAEQVVQRLRAAIGRASRNRFKPLLGAVAEVEAMTDDVLEISLVSPRPNFLQLLAQPELAIMRSERGSGPYRIERGEGGALRLVPPPQAEDAEEDGEPADPPILLSAGPAPRAVARFVLDRADLVLGGTVGDLPLARAAGVPQDRLVFDPVAGLFGLAFTDPGEGPLSSREARHALSMAIDRQGLVTALAVPNLAPRASLVPAGLADLPRPAAPAWAGASLASRLAAARRLLAGLEEPLETVRVALPEGPGHDLLFAHLRRDWAAIGLAAERVGPEAEADLRLVDEVAPGAFPSWYMRPFSCESRGPCDPAADEMMEAARIAPATPLRRALLANADRLLADAAVFVPLAAPVRWSLVDPRLTGFRPNPFGRHPAVELIDPEP